ncbi:hypothetical protein GCM10009799_32680 [Nocardiopsis rhodophaea]|uniref:Uncharacterized protein n=1 Tax=Nocardiopsis rhodophaea TaxID=280238 RepID=A0ABN2TA57_9ACTN
MSTDRSRSKGVVALLADIPTTGHLGSAQAERFALKGDNIASRSSDFLDFTARRLSEGKKVVALYPKWHAEHAERAIAFARGALQTDHIAQVALDISPLALSLVADQLAYLSPYVPSGVTAALAEELPQHILAGAWLKRVNNLSTIPITFKQHLGSYLPKTTFLAFNAPVKRVGRVKKGNPRPNLPSRPIDPVQVLVTRPENYDVDEFNEQLTPALRAVSLSALPEQPLGPVYWGVRKYIEFVVFSAHPQALPSTTRTVRPNTCSWCRDLVSALYCPYCGTINQPAAGRPPTRSADVPPPPAKRTGEHIRPAWISQQGAQADRSAPSSATGHPSGPQPSAATSRAMEQAGGHPPTGTRPNAPPS